MKLEDARGYYERHSTKASDVCRQLALAGLGVVWIFKSDVNGVFSVPADLLWPSLFMILTLALDLLQYISGALLWGIYNRYKEKTRTPVDQEFTAPPPLNWPIIVCFWLKMATVMVGYYFLLSFAVARIRH